MSSFTASVALARRKPDCRALSQLSRQWNAERARTSKKLLPRFEMRMGSTDPWIGSGCDTTAPPPLPPYVPLPPPPSSPRAPVPIGSSNASNAPEGRGRHEPGEVIFGSGSTTERYPLGNRGDSPEQPDAPGILEGRPSPAPPPPPPTPGSVDISTCRRFTEEEMHGREDVKRKACECRQGGMRGRCKDMGYPWGTTPSSSPAADVPPAPAPASSSSSGAGFGGGGATQGYAAPPGYVWSTGDVQPGASSGGIPWKWVALAGAALLLVGGGVHLKRRAARRAKAAA